MKLYWAPKTRSITIVWLLEEIGAPYERELIDIRAGAQDTADYRAVNPMGKVPVVALGEAVVAEQGAICALLADRFPDAGLAPGVNDERRADYLKWLFFAGNCIEPAYMQKASGWTTEKATAGWGNDALVADVLEAGLKDGPWLLGETFSAADVMIGCSVWFGLQFGLLDKRPVFEAYAARCTMRPAFVRAREIDSAGV